MLHDLHTTLLNYEHLTTTARRTWAVIASWAAEHTFLAQLGQLLSSIRW